MFKKIFFSVLFLTSSLTLNSQTWGIYIGNLNFPNNNLYYYPQPVITYMPQTVYTRPYQYMPLPQPIIMQRQTIYYPFNPQYRIRCHNNW